jgi:hypothetical protein
MARQIHGFKNDTRTNFGVRDYIKKFKDHRCKRRNF